MDAKKVFDTFNSPSVLQTMEKMTRCEMKLGSLSTMGNVRPSYDYSVIIGIVGIFKGAITMSFKQETAFYLLSKMMGNHAPKEFDETAESAMRELANIVVSKALILSAGSAFFNITPPALVKGHDVSCSVGNVEKSFVTMFVTPGGVIAFDILLLGTKNIIL